MAEVTTYCDSVMVFNAGAGWCGVWLPWVTGRFTYAISSHVQQAGVINII